MPSSPARTRVRFPGISPRAYEHPADRTALVALRRTGPAPSPATRSLVRAAFGQRRKTLANALAGA